MFCNDKFIDTVLIPSESIDAVITLIYDMVKLVDFWDKLDKKRRIHQINEGKLSSNELETNRFSKKPKHIEIDEKDDQAEGSKVIRLKYISEDQELDDNYLEQTDYDHENVGGGMINALKLSKNSKL